jgi:hypothetical protein
MFELGQVDFLSAERNASAKDLFSAGNTREHLYLGKDIDLGVRSRATLQE